MFACGQEGNHFVDNILLKDGSLPAVLIEALRARCGLEPAYRRRLLKTDAPRCDYYPLNGESNSPAAWAAYQLDMPQAGKGTVEVFRRHEARETSLRVKPHGLDPVAIYDLQVWLGAFDPHDDVILTGVAPAAPAGIPSRLTGRQLMEEGLLLSLAARPQVAWIVYQRAKGLAAMAEASCPRGEIPLAVVLQGNRSAGGAGAIEKYVWNLGDGTTAAGPTVQHVYRSLGRYTAELTVVDDKGAKDRCAVAIVATPVDSTPLAITRVDSRKPERIVVTFSKPVERTTAETVANYAIDQGVTVLSASLGDDPAIVTLATSPLSAGASYRLTVSNVRDRARRPNVIAADSQKAVSYSGLLAHWKLDEGRGDTVADSSGNGHHGAIRSGPQWAAGRRGPALRFDGKGYVEMDTCLPELAVPLSIAFWVNPAKVQVQNADILGNHGGGFVGLVVQQDAPNTNAFGLGYGDGTRWLGAGPVKLTADTWQHMAIVCDGRHATIYLERRGTEHQPGCQPTGRQSLSTLQAGAGLQP